MYGRNKEEQAYLLHLKDLHTDTKDRRKIGGYQTWKEESKIKE